MNEEWEQALSALADGEEVDPAVIKAALEAPEGRASLVEILQLRGLVREDLEELRVRAPLGRVARSWPWAARASAAAVIAAVAGLGAIDLAHHWHSRPAGEQPPKAMRVVRFETGVDWHVIPEEGGPL